MADGKVIIEIDGEADGFKDSLDEVGSSASRVGDIFKGSLKAELVAKGIELAAQAAMKLAGALVDLGKTALQNYASYEQLTGGIETLFGESADVVQQYAANAYQTAGMSANAYMETVTSFSASLIQGLGGDTAEAARVADMAITDMSDNANKMGTDIGMLQNAYQGFAKGNFTMLDNLKLGYGGTREEMIRLINDSGVLDETITSLDGITLDQMISAIHAVQEQMGITGTTAAEASTTIEGSLNAAKAAWDNLLTGMANPDADMGALVDQFVSAAETAMDNMIPVLSRIGEAAGPMLESLGTAIGEHSEELVGAAKSIIKGLINGLKGAASGMGEAMPELITGLINALPELAGDLLDLGLTIVSGIVEGIINALGDVFGRIWETLGPIIDEIGEAITTAFDNFFNAMDYYDASFDEGTIGADGYLDGIVEGVESRKGEVEDSVTGVIDQAGAAGEARAEKLSQATGQTIDTGTADGVAKGAGKVADTVAGMVNDANERGTSEAGGATKVGGEIDSSTAGGVGASASEVNSATTGMVDGAVSAGQGAAAGSDKIGHDIASGAAAGIRAYASRVATAAANMVAQAKRAAEAAAQTGSPSKLFRDEIGKMISAGVAIGIEQGGDWVNDAIRTVITDAYSEASAAIEGVVPDMEDSFALLTTAMESQLNAIDLLFETKLKIIGNRAQSALDQIADEANAAIDGIDADIAAIKAEQERREEEKELAEHEEKLTELRQKYNEAKLEDRAKIQKEIDDCIADWDEKQLRKQEQAEIARLNAEKKALQEQQKAEEKAIKERQKAEETAIKKQQQSEKRDLKARIKQQEAALKEYAKAWEDGLKELTDTHEKAMQDIADQQEGLFNKLRSGGELTYVTDAGQYRLADLTKDTKAIKTYGDELLKLRDRGVNEDLWNEILGMDQASATKFAKKLNKLNDEAYAAYMQSYADKQAAAAEVAESIFGPVREATEADYLAELPDRMKGIGASAMSTLAATLGEDGQEAIDAARTIADGVIAEFNRINSDALIKGKLMGMIMANNAELAGVVNDAWALQEANAGSSAMRQAMANGVAASGLNSAEREIVMVVNGTEFARATIGDYRAVESQSPQIRSD